MAAIINVAGATPVSVGTGSGGTLEPLGYTRDGCSLTFESFVYEVHSDDYGGESGPPIDIQYMGETVRIRLELTKYDEAVADKIRCRLRGGTAGTVGATGSLMLSSNGVTSLAYRICLISTTRPLNFPICVFKEPIEINKGTKFSTLVLDGTAYRNSSGLLWDTTTA